MEHEYRIRLAEARKKEEEELVRREEEMKKKREVRVCGWLMAFM